MAAPYRVCPICGSHNDPGEKCSCNGIAPKPAKRRKSKTEKRAAGETKPVIFTVVKNGHTYTFCKMVEAIERSGSSD